MKPLFDEYARRNALFSGIRLNAENVTGYRIIGTEDKPTDNTTVEFTFDRAINDAGDVDMSRVNPRVDRIGQRIVTITRPTMRELLVTTGVISAESNVLTAGLSVLPSDTAAQATQKFKTAFAGLCNFGDDINVVYINQTTVRVMAKPNALGCRGFIDVSAAPETESP